MRCSSRLVVLAHTSIADVLLRMGELQPAQQHVYYAVVLLRLPHWRPVGHVGQPQQQVLGLEQQQQGQQLLLALQQEGMMGLQQHPRAFGHQPGIDDEPQLVQCSVRCCCRCTGRSSDMLLVIALQALGRPAFVTPRRAARRCTLLILCIASCAALRHARRIQMRNCTHACTPHLLVTTGSGRPARRLRAR